MQIINAIIPGTNNRPITVDVHYKGDGKKKSIVIFSHGFKGFKDWGHFNYVAEKFAENGFVFVKFNFSHNGTTPESMMTFDELEAFGKNNYPAELNDLGIVIDWVMTNKSLGENFDRENIFLMGHSRGGAISIIKAAEDKRVKKLATWAAVSDLVNRNKKNTVDNWAKNGVVYTINARTGQQMPLYYQFYETIIANKERLNVISAARRLTIPFLIIHGTNDEAVKIADGKQLHRACKNSELLEIQNAGHTFGIRHPFTEQALTGDALTVIKRSLLFFKE